MKIGWIFLAILLAACQGHTPTPFEAGEWIDLTHTFDEQTVYWPTADGFKLDTVFEGMTDRGFYYSAFAFSGAEHGGTHVDAPVHFAAGKHTTDQIPLDQLIGEAAVVDVTEMVSGDIDYLITVDDILAWEQEHGPLPDGALVLFRTGFGSFWPDKLRYMGTNQRGPSAVALLHFPGLSPEAAEWLTLNRKIAAVGIDTPSIDFGRSSEFKTHRILFEQNIPAFENLANLDRLPEAGAYVMALPMKIKNGSGGPLRAVAWVSGTN